MHVRVLAAALAAAVSAGLGLTAAFGQVAAPPPLYPIPAPAAYPSPCPPPPRPVPKHPHPHKHPHKPRGPLVADADLPAVPAVPAHKSDLRAVSGKGMWFTTWADSTLDVDSVVAAARTGGLRQLWVRTGGTRQGWYGAPLLNRLLPAAHRAGIAVIAWDFPTLSDPVEDSLRASEALRGTFGGERIDGFSPDIETRSEGTFNSPQRVSLYLAHVRLAAGDRPVIATVMRPTPDQLRHYPYQAEAPFVDAFAPMDYWSCHEPGATAADSIQALATLRPVTPIGQAYDMASEGGRPGMPTAAEVWRFVDSARRAGAIGASLYDAETATDQERKALDAYPWAPGHWSPGRSADTPLSAARPAPSPTPTTWAPASSTAAPAPSATPTPWAPAPSTARPAPSVGPGTATPEPVAVTSPGPPADASSR